MAKFGLTTKLFRNSCMALLGFFWARSGFF